MKKLDGRRHSACMESFDLLLAEMFRETNRDALCAVGDFDTLIDDKHELGELYHLYQQKIGEIKDLCERYHMLQRKTISRFRSIGSRLPRAALTEKRKVA